MSYSDGFTEEQEAVRRVKVFAGILSINSLLRPVIICSALDKTPPYFDLPLGKKKVLQAN